MSNQLVANAGSASDIKYFRILLRTLHVVEFAVSHFAFYTRLEQRMQKLKQYLREHIYLNVYVHTPGEI